MSHYNIQRLDGSGHHIGDGGHMHNVIHPSPADAGLPAMADHLVNELEAHRAGLAAPEHLLHVAALIRQSIAQPAPDSAEIQRMLAIVLTDASGIPSVTVAAERVVALLRTRP